MVAAIRVRRFSAQEVFAQVQRAADMPAGVEPDQVRYLASYLRKGDTPARSMVVESTYVDRHYLEEFTGYYASKLHPPSSHATRIHFFSVDFDERSFREKLKEAVDAYQATCDSLSDAYLGFVVVRPIPGAPIGRTLLRPYSDRKSRCFAPIASGTTRTGRLRRPIPPDRHRTIVPASVSGPERPCGPHVPQATDYALGPTNDPGELEAVGIAGERRVWHLGASLRAGLCGIVLVARDAHLEPGYLRTGVHRAVGLAAVVRGAVRECPVGGRVRHRRLVGLRANRPARRAVVA